MPLHQLRSLHRCQQYSTHRLEVWADVHGEVITYQSMMDARQNVETGKGQWEKVQGMEKDSGREKGGGWGREKEGGGGRKKNGKKRKK